MLSLIIKFNKNIVSVPHDCSDIPSRSRSGVYKISTTGTSKFDVFCDMEIEGGGWTVSSFCVSSY